MERAAMNHTKQHSTVVRLSRTRAVSLIILASLIGLIGGTPAVSLASTSKNQVRAVTAATTCAALQVVPNTSVGGFVSEQYRWRDSNCQPRSAALVHNNVKDPAGKYGGYMRQFTYTVNGAVRTVNGSPGNHPGFGYTTNHYGPDGSRAFLSHTAPGTSYRTLLKGANHAIHEYKMRLPLGGPAPINATIHWFFATGRDNPIWAITYDSRPAGANTIKADTRSPYGDLQWDGGANAPVAGVAWGDHYKFRTTSTPLSFDSQWDYSQPNTVPYASEWTSAVDAEMGLVQTQTYQQKDAGGYWGYSLWGKTSQSPNIPAGTLQQQACANNACANPCAAVPCKMPADYNWPYQLNQYEIPFQKPVTSKRMAWGSNFGAVGQTQYPALGDAKSLSGYPFQSYSVAIVLGQRTKAAVATQVREIETVQRTSLVARTGTVATQGPAGIARTDPVAYRPAGYNHIYSTWELAAAANNSVDFDMRVASGSLKNPIFVVRNYTAAAAPQTIIVNGVTKRTGVDFFPTLDTVNKKLWLSLLGTFSGTTRIRVGAGQPVAEPFVTVYANAPAAGWSDWSWEPVTRNLANTTPVRAGTKSIAVTYTGAWSGFKLGRNAALNVAAYDVLRFWVHGGASGNQKIVVHIVNASGNVEVKQAITPVANTWTRVQIPLSGLAVKQVTAIEWFNNTAGAQPTFYLDDISFVDVAGH